MTTLTSLLTMDLMMQIIGLEQHYFGLLQCTLINILLYLSHLLQNKTLYLPQILGQIYIGVTINAHFDYHDTITITETTIMILSLSWHTIMILSGFLNNDFNMAKGRKNEF